MKETLIEALTSAGKELLTHFGKNIDFKVKESQSSIVTQADLKSDELISALIRKRFPTHNIVSEESGFRNMKSRYTWVIDPLDGTSNFASAIPWFGVLIALFDENIPVIGGAYLPVLNQIYIAEKGKGVVMNGKPFSMPKDIGLKNSLVAFNIDFTDNEKVLNESLTIYKNLVGEARNIRCTNSLVDFLYVADGKFGGVINLFTKIWDISALGLIIEEAGGVMTYANGEKISFRFDENVSEINFPVMAGSEAIISELQRSVMGKL